MRLQKFLTEKYMTAVQHSGNTYEIFKNPSKKEIKEAYDFTGSGYRFLIDFKNKNFYVWAETMFHNYAMTEIKKTDQGIPTFQAYWYKGKGGGDIFTGSSTGRSFYSDYIGTIEDAQTGKAYLKHDWNWLKKYINIEEIYEMIEETIV